MGRKASSYTKRRAQRRFVQRYTPLHELLASAVDPMPSSWRVAHLTAMWEALNALASAPQPTMHDWLLCADAVSAMETLVNHSPWPMSDGSLLEVRDESGLLSEACDALVAAAKRRREGGLLRLEGAALQAVGALLENYGEMLQSLPARTVIKCFRLSGKRLLQAMEDKNF